MVAPVKFSQMSEQERENTANGIMSAISEKVAEVGRCEVKVWDCGHGIRPFGDHVEGSYIDFSVSVGRKEFRGLGKQDLFVVANALVKKVKAAGMECETKYHERLCCDIPVSVSMLKECKEFKELQKLLKRKGLDVGKRDIYECSISGKRGRIMGEGWRDYACEKPCMCERIISQVKAWGRKKVSLSLKVVDDVDPADVEHSRYCETELYGYRRVEVVVTPLAKRGTRA